MKKLIVSLIVPLMVVAFLVATVCPAAAEEGPYRRVVIGVLPWGVSVAIQPIGQLPDGSWEKPNGVTAFVLEPWPQAIYMPWAGRVSPGGRLSVRPGSTIFLYRDWGAEDEPLRLVVVATQTIVAEDEESLVLDRVGGRLFALVTYPPCGNMEQRLVVWAVADCPH